MLLKINDFLIQNVDLSKSISFVMNKNNSINYIVDGDKKYNFVSIEANVGNDENKESFVIMKFLINNDDKDCNDKVAMLSDFSTMICKQLTQMLFTDIINGKQYFDIIGNTNELVKSKISKQDADTLQNAYELYQNALITLGDGI